MSLSLLSRWKGERDDSTHEADASGADLTWPATERRKNVPLRRLRNMLEADTAVTEDRFEDQVVTNGEAPQ